MTCRLNGIFLLLKIKLSSGRAIALWNRSEKVDHVAYKYLCVLQGCGIIKMIRNLAQSFHLSPELNLLFNSYVRQLPPEK